MSLWYLRQVKTRLVALRNLLRELSWYRARDCQRATARRWLREEETSAVP